MNREDAKVVERYLGIKRTNSLGIYLGMPSQNNRNKTKMFDKVRQKVAALLQGWNEKLFSIGGKEILIKAVIQAIPTYCISCFKLPKGLCDDINRMCARFWWGAVGDRRKIYWASWKKLCVSKDRGGIGFRDLSLFNQALLAKQSWRIMRDPESLLSKVLKGRYCRNGDFLNAPEGSNSSLVWKSIVWGRDLFKEGFRWRVGNGRHIYIDHDPWIPRQGSRTPVVVLAAMKGRRVCELILDNGDWNEPLIKNLFIPSDAGDILSIPLGLPSERDQIIWNAESKGFFSVKSAYHLTSNLLQAKESTGSGLKNGPGDWRIGWKLNIQPKVKIGLWKILKNWIPTKVNLIEKGMDLNPLCAFCRCSREDVNHIFWDCKQVRKIWSIFFPKLMKCVDIADLVPILLRDGRRWCKS